MKEAEIRRLARESRRQAAAMLAEAQELGRTGGRRELINRLREGAAFSAWLAREYWPSRLDEKPPEKIEEAGFRVGKKWIRFWA